MRLVSYSIVQGVAASADFVFFLFMVTLILIEPKIANVTAKLFGAGLAFFGLRYWVFKNDVTNTFKDQLLKYVVSLPLNIVISTAILALLLSSGVLVVFAKILTDIITFIIFFALNKYLIFK